MKSVKDLQREAEAGTIISLRNPQNNREAPVTDTNRKIFNESGPGLEFVTNSSGEMMKAVESCLNFAALYDDGDDDFYCTVLMEKIERLAAAHNNQRTLDAIEALRAGGPLPNEYYSDGGQKQNREASMLKEESEQ